MRALRRNSKSAMVADDMGLQSTSGIYLLRIAVLVAMLFCGPAAHAQAPAITVSNGTAHVSWPLTRYYYLLQSSTNLSGSNAWNYVGTASPVSALIGNALAQTNFPPITNFAANQIIFTQQTGNVSQFYRLKTPLLIPVFFFAIFYDQLLEFSDSPTILVNGFVHANGSIDTGPGQGASQIFSQTVTTAGTISSPANGGLASNYWSNEVYFNGNPPMITNTPPFVSPVGTNNPHVIIEIPPANENPDSTLGQERFFNEADVVLIVSNTLAGTNPSVRITLQTSYNGSDPGGDSSKEFFHLTNATPIYLDTNSVIQLPFLSLTNTFADQRESQTNMFVTQIDVGAYAAWLATNAAVEGKFFYGLAPILYVADRRNLGTNKLAVVRLVNGSELPYNDSIGFTVATQNPLYVQGNYNVTVDDSHFALSLGSTTNGSTVPAALIADAITILSSNWQDGQSGESYGVRGLAANMTVNAALVVGNVPSTGTTTTTYSGGVQNLTRFLEDWSNSDFVLNTSLVCLFSSEMATNQFQFPGAYFNPPVRQWGFDVTFLNLSRLPPGTPFYSLP
jgi:hypothetical protein